MNTKMKRLTPNQAFENTSTNVAAAQMRNALTSLAESVEVEDPAQKKVCYLHAPLWPNSFLGLTRSLGSFSRLRWTTSSPSSVAILMTRQRGTRCKYAST